MKAFRALFFVLAVALSVAGPRSVLAADTTAKAEAAKIAASKASASNEVASASPGATFQLNNYVLSPTDVITITVVDDPKATVDYPISVDGTVQLTYLAEFPVKLSGLTVAEAVKLVSNTYVDHKIFIKPTVVITVKQYAERRVDVFGAVGKQGPVYIPPQKKLTLLEAISEAGGPLPRAARTVTITRVLPDGTRKKFEDVNLWGAMHGEAPDFPLQEGDTIQVGESLFGDSYQN